MKGGGRRGCRRERLGLVREGADAGIRVGFGRLDNFVFEGIGFGDGLVGELGALAPEALEVLDRAAVEALGLGLIAEEKDEVVVFVAIQAEEAVGEGIIAILLAGDFDIADHLGLHRHEEAVMGVEGFVETAGEEAGLEAGGAAHAVLGDRNLLDGPKLLGIDGLVDGDEVLFKAGDLLMVLDADNGKAGGGEGVFAGVGSELFGGDRFIGHRGPLPQE